MARRRRSPGARGPGGERPHPAVAGAGTTRGRPGVRADHRSSSLSSRIRPATASASDPGATRPATSDSDSPAADDRDRGAGRGGSSGPGERHHEPDEHAEQHPQHDTEDRDGDDPPASQHRRGDRRLERTRGTGGRGPATGDPRTGGRQHGRAAPTGRAHRAPGVRRGAPAASPRAADAPRTARRAPSPRPRPLTRHLDVATAPRTGGPHGHVDLLASHTRSIERLCDV